MQTIKLQDPKILQLAYNLIMPTKSYTQSNECYQLVLPLNYEVLIPQNDSVRLLSQLLEGLNYEKPNQTYSSTGRKPAVEPRIMFKVLIYAYMNNIYSSRKIENACKRDINFMWLLEGHKAPDHRPLPDFEKNTCLARQKIFSIKWLITYIALASFWNIKKRLQLQKIFDP